MNGPEANSRKVGPSLIVGAVCAAILLTFFLVRHRRAVRVEKVEESGRSISTNISAAAHSPDPLPARTEASSSSPKAKTLLDRLAELSPDSVRRQEELNKIAAEIPDNQLERTLESLWESSGSGPAKELSRILVRRWAAQMPGVAAAWITHKQEGALRDELSLSVATVWANEKAADAAEWVRRWPAEQKDAGLLAIAYEASRKSPRDALWLASEMRPGDARNDLIRHAVAQWAGEDPQSAIAWTAQMEASPLRDQVVENVSLVLSENDPKAAATLALESLTPGKAQNDVIVGIVQRWVQKEPAESAKWVSAFPEGELRNTAIENLVSLWAGQAPDDAAVWLDTLEPGDTRDVAIAALSNQLAGSTPQEAATWVEQINDPERRALEMERLGNRWMATDNAAARKWIESAPLPEKVKSRLLSSPGATP